MRYLTKVNKLQIFVKLFSKRLWKKWVGLGGRGWSYHTFILPSESWYWIPAGSLLLTEYQRRLDSPSLSQSQICGTPDPARLQFTLLAPHPQSSIELNMLGVRTGLNRHLSLSSVSQGISGYYFIVTIFHIVTQRKMKIVLN